MLALNRIIYSAKSNLLHQLKGKVNYECPYTQWKFLKINSKSTYSTYIQAMNWALSPRVFYISRSHLDVGFQKACEVTGWSNSRSLYYGKSVECLCSGNINKLKLSSDIKDNPSDLHGYLLPSLLSNSKASCRVQARITVLSGPILQMRREPQDDRRHTKKYKNFLNFTPIFYLNQEFSKNLPHCYRE